VRPSLSCTRSPSGTNSIARARGSALITEVRVGPLLPFVAEEAYCAGRKGWRSVWEKSPPL
jgi:hypothetical protein